MTKVSELTNQFCTENDLSDVRTTILSIALRDAVENPELYKNSDLQEVIVELHSFLEKLERANNERKSIE